jgi:hypothetical protein
MDANMHSAYR